MSQELQVIALVSGFAVLLLWAMNYDKVWGFIKDKFIRKNKQGHPGFSSDWLKSDIKIGIEPAGNGMVIRAYLGLMHHGGTEVTTKTRVVTDESAIGVEVMALIAEIKLGK